MSLPSDHEDSKKIQETLSSGDSAGEEVLGIGPDGKKKKRRSKKLLKPAGVLADLEVSPGTSNNSKTERNGNASKDTELAAGNSGSNSGDKNVGEVRDDIEQLKLNEEMVKNLDKKLSEPTEELQASPCIGLPPQPEVPASGTTISNEEVQLALQNVLENEPVSSTDLEIHGYVPPNTLNESLDTDEMSLDQDSNVFSTTQANLKRALFAQNAENTLDDVSDITPDISDLQTDSSSGRQEVFHPARIDTRSSAENEDSSVSEYKTVESIIHEENDDSDPLSEEKKLYKRGELSTGKIEVSDYKTAEDGDSSSQHNLDEKGGSSKSDCGDKENISDEKLNLSKKDCVDDMVPQTEGSVHEIKIEESGSNVEVGEEAIVDQVRDLKEEAKNGAYEYDRKNKMVHEDLGEHVPNPPEEHINVVEPCQEDGLEENVGRHEMDHSINDQDNSDGQGGADGQPSGSEKVDGDGSGRQGTSDDQSNMVDQEASGEQDVSEQGNDNFENFAAGQFARYPIDSTTSPSDSGFDNSDAVFMRNDRPNELAQYEVPAALQDNSEDTSSLAASGLAGLNELQRWMGVGERVHAAGPVPHVAPSNQPVPELLEERLLNLNAPIDQPAPSTSDNQSDWPPPGVVYLAKQQVLNVPMECAEQFDSQSSDGKDAPKRSAEQSGEEKLEPNLNLDAESTASLGGKLGPRPISSRADMGQESIPDDMENCNANQGDEGIPENRKLQTTLDPKTSRPLVRDVSEPLSSESMEHSPDGSLADMDDAIESSEYSRSDVNVNLPGDLKTTPKVLRSDDRPLEVGPKTEESCSKQKADKKKLSHKRLAKETAEKKLKKKRKGIAPCRNQARANVDIAMETSSSDEKSEE